MCIIRTTLQEYIEVKVNSSRVERKRKERRETSRGVYILLVESLDGWTKVSNHIESGSMDRSNNRSD